MAKSWDVALGYSYEKHNFADGLDDRLEQALLERFLPTFLLSAGECDGLPASFEPGSPEPRLRAKNGTIYGQVFRVAPMDRAQVAVEIHYFHLWANDCGRGGHPLDAEHVSALVESTSLSSAADQWTARLWYAAAHEDTICDASSGARASSLDAERGGGPRIFVSRGKHASYLTRGQCKWGCGVDACGGQT